ncbi:DUF58 domain-containing protein [Priestia megaterium]|nr:DUF58 domain-containing protein [Priestia megaterium]
MKPISSLRWNRMKETIFLIGLFAVTFMYAMFQGGFVSWFLFYSFLPFGIYAFLLLIYPLKRWTIQRNISAAYYQSGDVLIYTLKIKRAFPFPLYFLSIEDLVDSGQKLHLHKTIYPLWKKEVLVEFQVPYIQRGEHQFLGVNIEISDLLGIVHRKQYYPCEQLLLVYPRLHEVSINLLSSGGTEGASHTARSAHYTMLVSGVRDYEQGDRLSTIDWKSTARKGTLMSKEFDQQVKNEPIIVFDAIDPLHFEPRINFVASLIVAYLKQNRSASFVCVGEAFFSKEVRGGAHTIAQWLRYFTQLQPSAKQSFGVELQAMNVTKQQSLIVIISTLTEQVVQQIQAKANLHVAITIFIVREGAEAISDKERMVIGRYSMPLLNFYIVDGSQYRQKISEVGAG